MMIELGVNIDHVATVRQARRTYEPDPVVAAALAEIGGADGITVHLREDRRHIQDRDIRVLSETITVKFNFELSCAEEIVEIACQSNPDQATLVPERRDEVTTEGGLDVIAHRERILRAIEKLHNKSIAVSLFLDPEIKQIEAASKLGVMAVELHTGQYALATDAKEKLRQLARLQEAASAIVANKMSLHAGHGLTYQNVGPIASIPNMKELNIGHSIVSRSLMVGMKEAVSEMKHIVVHAATVANTTRV
jgi:pyridoxine 5-phosphate synthase